MARPSQEQDTALLRAGLALYPQLGCAGLSVRRVAEHAGVTPAMLHYHFGGKPAFLRAVLQQVYETMFARLSDVGGGDGPALPRLRAALFTLATFLREHRPLLARLLIDAAAEEAVAVEFLRANAPRHLGLLMQLLAQAEQEGSVAQRPSLQRFMFVMSAVAAPILVAAGVARLNVAPELVTDHLDAQVLSDAAIRERIELALSALGATGPEVEAGAQAGAGTASDTSRGTAAAPPSGSSS